MQRPISIPPAIALPLLGLLGLGAGFALFVSSLDIPESATTTLTHVPEQAPVEDVPFTLLAAGDIMLGRYVETLMNAKGGDYPFAHIDDTLRDADITFANLEGPIVTDHRQTPDDSLVFSFPASSAALLARHAFDVVSLANNHTLNQGEAGFTETQNFLRAAGVLAAGHPEEVDAATVVHMTAKDRNVSILAFAPYSPNFPEADALALIRSERAAAADAFLVVSSHWGTEYRLTNTAAQQRLGRAFIDAGADVVIGHHPHVVENIEVYDGKLIFYSLGNFIFDQYFSGDTQNELLVRLTVSGSAVTADLLPARSTRSQPALMTGDERDEFLQALADRSDGTLSAAIAGGSITLPAD